jgi:hypothetical protein
MTINSGGEEIMNKNETLEQKVYRYIAKHTPKGHHMSSFEAIAGTVDFRHMCLAFREAMDDAAREERDRFVTGATP